MSEFETDENKKLTEAKDAQVNNDVSQDDGAEIIPDEAFESIPEEARGEIKNVFRRQTMISEIMKKNNPISDKITSEHIT